MKELPIACTLSTAALETRRSQLRDFRRKMKDRRLSDTNFLAKFDSDAGILTEIARFAGIERECCRFLRFQITAEEDCGPIWLDISGPSGTGRFLEDMIAG